MIECLIDAHKDIFYSTKSYAKHILTKHPLTDKELIKWAKRHTK